MKRCAMLRIFVISAVMAVSLGAAASPIIRIGEGGNQSWDDAMTNGNINPLTGIETGSAADSFFNATVAGSTVLESFHFANPFLTPDIDVELEGQTHESLVMQWNPSGVESDLPVAGWEYVYDVDPDLTNMRISFSLGVPPPPGGIWDVGLELVDVNGLTRGWFMSMPPVGWYNLLLDPTVQGTQGPFTHFFENNGFDITQVLSINLYEAGNSVSLPVPPGTSTSQGTQWNAWNHLKVSTVPEPATVVLFGMGLLGVACGARRRRQQHR